MTLLMACRVRCSFYIKNAHRGVIPGLQEFGEEYVSEASLRNPADTSPSVV